jgi:hypothetical protein
MSDDRTGDDWRPLGDEQPEQGSVVGGAPAVATSAFDMLSSLPRLLGRALDDLSTIAHHIQRLPELARLLAEIDRGVRSLDDEVRKMRQAVESMGGDVEGLHPRLDDLQRSIPLNRLRRRGRDSERDKSTDAG